MMRGLRHIFTIFVVLLIVSCKQDELCYDHTHYPYVSVSMDLTGTNLTFASDLKSYMVVFYPYDDGIILESELDDIQQFRMQYTSDFTFKVSPGTYDVLIYSDYTGQITFGDITSYDGIYAVAQSSKSLSNVRADDDPDLVPMPDHLVVGKYEMFEVVDYGKTLNETSPAQQLSFMATKATHDLSFKLYLENINSMYEVETFIGYVDSKYYISQQRSNEGGAEMYISHDTDCVTVDKTSGTVDIKGVFFGFTGYGDEDEGGEDEGGEDEGGEDEGGEDEGGEDEGGEDEGGEDEGGDGRSVATRSTEVTDYYVYFSFTLNDGTKMVTDKVYFTLDQLTSLMSGGTVVFGSDNDAFFTFPVMIGTDGGGGFNTNVESWDDEVVTDPYLIK